MDVETGESKTSRRKRRLNRERTESKRDSLFLGTVKKTGVLARSEKIGNTEHVGG